MADPDQVVARNDERLRRLKIGEAAQVARARRRERAQATLGKRVGRGAGVVGALVLAVIVWGLLVGPIGIGGLMLVFLAGLVATALAVLSVGTPPEPTRLGEAVPAALPAATDAWLDRRRRELPALAAPQLDAISAQLATLETQLARVPAGDPVAQDVSRLLAKHLPELVESYTRVPAEQRKRTIETDGRTLDAALVDGLKVVEEELARASDSLAEGDRDALVVQGKFLESRYKGDAGV
ncbi:hypothetical protein IP88_15940 [alpha proteobacterium AAP81b]|nr:hypothetical protein IP88_15940 [alpha proteobacterium AAP81b]